MNSGLTVVTGAEILGKTSTTSLAHSDKIFVIEYSSESEQKNVDFQHDSE